MIAGISERMGGGTVRSLFSKLLGCFAEILFCYLQGEKSVGPFFHFYFLVLASSCATRTPELVAYPHVHNPRVGIHIQADNHHTVIASLLMKSACT